MSLLAGEAELLLDGELDRQAVAVPAGLADHVVALHRPEAGEHVLEDPGLDVVDAGLAVGGRRALVERPRLAVRGLLEARGEGVVLVPEREDVALQRRQVDLRRERTVAGRLSVLLRHGVGAPSAGVDPAEGTRPWVRPRGTTLLGRPWGDPLGCALLPVLVASLPGRSGLSSGGSGVMAPSSPAGTSATLPTGRNRDRSARCGVWSGAVRPEACDPTAAAVVLGQVGDHLVGECGAEHGGLLGCRWWSCEQL